MNTTITTYPEMNAQIVKLLRINSEDAMSLYAAQLIEEMQGALQGYRDALSEIHEYMRVAHESRSSCSQEQNHVAHAHLLPPQHE